VTFLCVDSLITDSDPFWSLVNRYYDPATGEFLSVDPLVQETGEPYAYTEDDPVNGADPLGLGCGILADVCNTAATAWNETAGKVVSAGLAVGEKASTGLQGIERLEIDIPQDALYLEYWGSYEAINRIDAFGCQFGSVGTAVGYVVSAPLLPFEAEGLEGDAAGNLLKGETIWQEGHARQPLLGNEMVPFTHINAGRDLSNALGLPLVTFPGYDYTGGTNFAW
jgi:hypothetical protein